MVLSTVSTIHEDITQQSGWLFSEKTTQSCVNRQDNPWGQRSRHVEGMIVQWQLHRVLSTVMAIHEDTTQQTCWGDDCSVTTTQGSVHSQGNPWRHNTADRLTGWLFTDSCTQLSTVKTIHEDNTADMLRGWLFSDIYTEFCQQSSFNLVTVNAHTTNQFCNNTHKQMGNNTHDQVIW